MNSDMVEPITEFLSEIANTAAPYFETSITEFPEDTRPRWQLRRQEYWTDLSQQQKDVANQLADRLATLAHLTGPAIQRSPLLTEIDQRETGYALKSMRSALRFRRYRHWDTQVLHDEDTVLGVQPGGEEEEPVTPVEAKQIFDECVDSLKNRLELADPHQAATANTIGSAHRVGTRPIAAGYRPNTAFIMMWMSPNIPELMDVTNAIKDVFKQFDVDALRADDIEHEDIITERILDEIKTAEFLFADLTGERPSVYYEVGYAQALGRRVILFRKAGTPIHFDLAAYNCPEYKNLTELKTMLTKRLESVTGRLPLAGGRVSP